MMTGLNPKKELHLRSVLTTAYTDYQKGLNARAFFKTSSHATGEDLVQNTFMKTWVYLVRGGEVHIMKAFLYHILNNLIVDEYRKHKTTSLDTLIEKGFDPRDEDETEHLNNTFDGKALILLIERLPDKYQKTMRMRYIQDLSLKEISLLTGQSKNTIAVQIHRGLSKLRLLYGSTRVHIH